MAVLLFLLAMAGVALVGDLVLENTAPASVTVLDRSFGGYTEGQLLAAVAVVGFVVGVLAVASVSLRRARRVRRRELRQTEQDLTAEVDELANYRQSRRPAGAAMPADRPPEPVYDEARRVARLHGSDPNR